MVRLRQALHRRVGKPWPAPTAPAVNVLPSRVTAAQSKATGATSQWAAFKSRLDTNLATASLPLSQYQGSSLQWAAEYALGYQCLKGSDASTASKYADKALGMLRFGLYGSQKGVGTPAGAGVYLGRCKNTGGQTFTIPDADFDSSTLLVYKCTVTTTAVTKGTAGGQDFVRDYAKFLKVSNSSDGTADYAQTTDWLQPGPGSPYVSGDIDWSPAGIEPTTGATYYVTWADVTGINVNPPALHSPADYTLSGTTLTLTNPIGTGFAIVAVYLHGTWSGGVSTVGYQQSYDGLGGLQTTVIDGPGYATRYLLFLACALDWLWDYALLDATTKANAIAQFIQWSDYIRDNGFGVTTAASNYGSGHFAMRSCIAAALQGRDAAASRLQTEVINWYATYVPPTLVTPSGTTGTHYGGHWSEGWNYGGLSLANLVLASDLHNELSWSNIGSLQAWFADVIKALFIEQMSQTTIYDGGTVYAFPEPFPSTPSKGQPYVLSTLAALTSDTTAAAYANWALQNYTVTNTNDFWDLLYRDPTATTSPFTSALPTGTLFSGTGLFVARHDYSYTTTWLSFHAGNQTDAAHQALGQGSFEVWRGGDWLIPLVEGLVGGDQSFQSKSHYGSGVLIDDFGAGDMTYPSTNGGPAQGVWYTGPNGCVITRWENQTGYAYATGDYGAAYGHNSSGVPNPTTELNRSLLYVRGSGTSDYLFLHDRVTTNQASYLKQFQVPLDPAATLVQSGASLTVTKGTSRLFLQVFADVALTTALTAVTVANPNDVKMFTAKPTSNVNTKVRYRTGIQVAPSTTGSADTMTDIPSTDAICEGVMVGTIVAMFGVNGSIAGGCSYSFTAGNGATVTHYVSDLQANHLYTLTGANQASATSSAAGVLTFTTTGTGSSQSVTIS